jgi:tetratricopeptide (TPR) repeat protein
MFVGREGELRQLQGAFDAALSGQGAIAMVVGELGIGKTSCCEQLVTYTAMRGGKALIGHCYEEGSLSLPYLPFVEAMRSYVLARDPDGLRQDLGSGAAEVARIVSEVRDRLPPAEVSVPQSSGPEDDRWRLLQAVTGFLRNASAVQPLLIVLEDLHDADRGTLDLLLHLSRNLQGSRLLIVGTYRDVEVDRSHPLSSALAELRRAAGFLRVPLRGLTVDEVHRMYRLIRGQEVPWSWAEAIHRQTEGNPLFVQEVLRYLVEEWLVVREGGRYALTPEGADAGIPEGLRDVVGKPLSRLSEKANQVLSVSSVIGRDFRLDVLQQVVSVSEDEMIEALEEAQERAVIEERGGVGAGGPLAFRFTHAFFRQTLYEEIFAARRIRWHQQARALEAVHARRLDEHAAELAEHYAHSSDPADLRKAVEYAERAARRAQSVYAYGEAVRHWEQARKAQEVLAPDDRAKCCDLLLAQGEAMLPLEEPKRVADAVASEAYALAEAMGDSDRAARAAVQAIEAMVRSFGTGASALVSAPETKEWAARCDRHARPGTVERIYADLALAAVAPRGAAPAEMHICLRRAVERAFDLNDNPAFFAAATQSLARLLALRDRELRQRLVLEVIKRPHEGIRSGDLALTLHSAASALLASGQLALAEEAWREEALIAERTQDVTLRVRAMSSRSQLAFVDGKLEEVLSLREAQESFGQQLSIPSIGVDFLRCDACLLLGRTHGIADLLDAPGRPAQARPAVTLAHLGRHDEARTIIRTFGNLDSPDDESSSEMLVNALEASSLGQDRELMVALSRRLAPLAAEFSMDRSVSVGRLLGDAARQLQQRDAARDYYAQALAACERIRQRPETALIHLGQAELLLDGSPVDQAEALDHLDFAIEELQAMKMQPALERALRHKGLLHA